MENDRSEELHEAIASTMIRISCLEKVLIDSGVIDKENYIAALKKAAQDFSKEVEKITAENAARNKKILS